MTPSLILEGFGELPVTDLIESELERERQERENPSSGATVMGSLHAVFDARAELMAWSTTSPSRRNLWNLYEAGLTGRGPDETLIGWVYVGLANPTEPGSEIVLEGSGTAGWATVPVSQGYSDSTVALPTALVPLIQCLDDSLRRIGAVDVSGFQISCYDAYLSPRDRAISRLTNGAGWFRIPEQEKAHAFITFDQGLLGGHTAAELLDRIQHRFLAAFSFDQVALVPEQYRIFNTPGSTATFQPSEHGIAITLPEWTGSAAGWVLATVVDAARGVSPDAENFAVRVARV